MTFVERSNRHNLNQYWKEDHVVILILDNVRHLLVLLRGPDAHLHRPLGEVHLDVAVVCRGNADVVGAVGAGVG